MLKSIIISFTTIFGVFFILLLVTLVFSDDNSGNSANSQVPVTATSNATEIGDKSELVEADIEVVEHLDFFESELKIVSID